MAKLESARDKILARLNALVEKDTPDTTTQPAVTDLTNPDNLNNLLTTIEEKKQFAADMNENNNMKLALAKGDQPDADPADANPDGQPKDAAADPGDKPDAGNEPGAGVGLGVGVGPGMSVGMGNGMGPGMNGMAFTQAAGHRVDTNVTGDGTAAPRGVPHGSATFVSLPRAIAKPSSNPKANATRRNTPPWSNNISKIFLIRKA